MFVQLKERTGKRRQWGRSEKERGEGAGIDHRGVGRNGRGGMEREKEKKIVHAHQMCSIRMNKNIFPLEDFKTDLGKGRQTLCSGRACWGLQQKNKLEKM